MFAIGIAGQAQMGKDTVADWIQEKLNIAGGSWKRKAFASNVKRIFCETFGVDLAFVEKWKANPAIPPGFSMNIRQSLQFIGDGFRTIQPNIWLDLVFRDEHDPIIVSDVRYINEFIRVDAEGGYNVLVIRPDKLSDDPNGSEAQIRPFIVWCMEYLPKKKVVLGKDLKDLAIPKFDTPYRSMSPKGMELFDAVVFNDGTKEDLHNSLDLLVEDISQYVFDFTAHEPKKEFKCHISH